MYLEKGIEEFGENHKPSPFTIGCPYCGGWASDISGIQKVPGNGYVPLPDGCSYFANREDRDCGVPVFREARRTRSRPPILIADELDRAEEIVQLVKPDEEIIEKVSAIVAENAAVPLKQAFAIVLKALQSFGDELKKALAPFMGEPDDLQKTFGPGEPPIITTAWDRKESREKQREVERAAASRLRQYKASEKAWSARKRTGPRGREWRGADRT